MDTAQLVVLNLSPATLGSASDLRPLSAEGQPAGKGWDRFHNHPLPQALPKSRQETIAPFVYTVTKPK